MTITPSCDKCGKELSEFGGLAFSPPDDDGKVSKYHICRQCFSEMQKSFKKR